MTAAPPHPGLPPSRRTWGVVQSATIKRGLATGDNGFFILPETEIARRGLPPEHFRPILPSPRHMPDNRIGSDAAGNPLIARRLFLLDCKLPEARLAQTAPSLWEYLRSGQGEVSEGYLCRKRHPWYAQEDRPAAPLLCTYMGRGERPFRFILNRSRATAANVYLLLYPRPPLEQAATRQPDLYKRIWAWLNAVKPDDLMGEGRVYGGGLHKLEPLELANLPAGWIDGLLPKGTWAGQTELFPAGVGDG